MTHETTTVIRKTSSVAPAEHDVLFRRMLEGDDSAFGSLFAAFDAKLRRYLMRQIGKERSEPLVDDVLQEVWVRFINLRRQPPAMATTGELFHVQAFLFRIARNLVIDRRRTQKEHAGIDTLDERFHPVTGYAERSDAEDIMQRAFERLPEDFREVLILNLELGYRFDEIAEMVGRTPEAIWQRASRARAKLRRLVVEIAKEEGVCLREYTAPE
jgi:RNA polymerase sigma-70 factor (ECF subfamily)